METIIIIPRELEYLEGLVKVARKKKNIETTWTQVGAIMDTPTIKQVCINKIHCNKIFHLVVEIHQTLIDGLVDMSALMSIMATNDVQELDIMHLVSGHKTYKTVKNNHPNLGKDHRYPCHNWQGGLPNDLFGFRHLQL
jgi:hypothetical protein